MSGGLVIDNFAGGGGASTGIEAALGRAIDVAINHDAEAVAMHAVNHPATHHLCQNVWKADPHQVVAEASARRGSSSPLPVELAWFSPDCKHFSKAKGSKPVEKGIRDLAWVVVLWARRVRPKVIMLENVEEFCDWGPLIETADGRLVPCPLSKGLTFKRWTRELKKLGYVVEHRELRASDYATPTIRKRLYVIARCDGQPIAWPAPSHAKGGAGGMPEWRWAAECIDFDLPCPSIFTRKKALAENTLRRIARGVMRYVVNAADPFLVSVAHGGSTGRAPYAWSAKEPLRTQKATPEFGIVMPVTHQGDQRSHPLDESFRTITGAHRGELALVSPFVSGAGGPSYGGKPVPVDQPFGVLPTENHKAVVVARIGQTGGGGKYANGVDEALTTITSKQEHLLVSACLVPRYGERPAQEPRALPIDGPMPVVVPTGNGGSLVATFLAKHYGGHENDGARLDACTSTITAKDHHALVAAALSHQYSSNTAGGQGDPRDPARTVTAAGTHHALLACELSDEDRAGAERVSAFLVKYYSAAQHGQSVKDPLHSATAKPRFGLVTVLGLPIVDIGMRMLTPRELFRAQGFPDWSASVRFSAWRGRTTQGVEDRHFQEPSDPAQSAAPPSPLESAHDPRKPVAVHALIDLGRGVLEIRSPRSDSTSASDAGAFASSPLPTWLADTARQLAPTERCADQRARHGVGAAPPKGRPSTLPVNGDGLATTSGGAMMPPVAVAASGMNIEIDESSKSITSQDGRNSQSIGEAWTTLCCYVADAIASSTPDATPIDCSYAVVLTAEHRYIIDRGPDGKPLTKTAQTRMCGNSVCPPVAEALVRANLVESADDAGSGLDERAAD